MPQHCIFPESIGKSDIDDDDNNNNDIKPVCWFVEKVAQYARIGYKIGPIYANFLPKIKLLMLVRNPIKQMVSYATPYYDEISHKNGKRFARPKNRRNNLSRRILSDSNTKYNSIEEYLYILYTENAAFNKIRQECIYLYQNLTKLEKNGVNYDLTTNFLNSDVIKQYFKVFLYESEVNDTLGTYLKKTSDAHKVFSLTVHVSSLLLYIYAYDEVFGYLKWNQFRVVQYEWLYGNMMQVLTSIKCWLQTDTQINLNQLKTIAKNDDTLFVQCPQVFYNDRNYFEHMEQVFAERINVKERHWSHATHTTDEIYVQKFEKYFKPFVKTLLYVLKQRPEVLLGGWVDWNIVH